MDEQVIRDRISSLREEKRFQREKCVWVMATAPAIYAAL